MSTKTGQLHYDIEARLRELLEGVRVESAIAESDEPVLVRDRLTLAEYASVLGIPISTMNRNVKVALASNDGFAFSGGPTNPKQIFRNRRVEQVLETHGPKKRFVVFSNLDLSGYTPAQISQMKITLGTPLSRG